MARLTSARIAAIRQTIEAEPPLVEEIGRALGWEPVEVREFLQGQFKAETDELKAIELVLKGQTAKSARNRY